MNSQSSYVYKEHSGGEGLGRIASGPTMSDRFMPSIEEAARDNRRIVLPIQRKSPVRRVSQPRPVPKPTPIIDHNPIPIPRLNIPAIRKAAQKKTSAKTTKAKPLEAAREKTNAKAAQTKGGGKGFLDGSISIGGYEIKKTHAAMAGGATAGGLLLLKLLL